MTNYICDFTSHTDRLGPPQRLEAIVSDHGVNLSFVEPYALPESKILYYNCIVKHTKGSWSQEVRLKLNDVNFSFVFSDYNITSLYEEQYIEFSVGAYNPAGMGNYSTKTVVIPGDRGNSCI